MKLVSERITPPVPVTVLTPLKVVEEVSVSAE
ncbi:MAG: hypothetical protein MOGMAGMI_01783 [Candidatus Omnitrophica bacterium]|nr:hypothetical protein [Candidatus Omnitrophota bacterium]